MKHTPGKWEVEGRFVIDENRMRIADLQFDKNGEELEANARLIATAPELLEVCKEMLIDLRKVCQQAEYRDLEGNTIEPHTPAMKKAIEAIAKAEGK